MEAKQCVAYHFWCLSKLDSQKLGRLSGILMEGETGQNFFWYGMGGVDCGSELVNDVHGFSKPHIDPELPRDRRLRSAVDQKALPE
ncbi:hypothetical protein AURDEDRAFT_146838 [Auricularia subglabra TFB-10046 SS5]|nr:hypothetical protein AURDEDRAFT_146838 [Auricularia subglabra TFB-10046 SS5]